jgi:hypothetical protein
VGPRIALRAISWATAVEFGREESRCRPQDLVGAAQLLDLALQLGDALLLGGGHPGAAAGVDLGLADPGP